MSEPERESMEVDVLFVGAGPATLASAYHLMKQVEAQNARRRSRADPIEPPVILVIEKAAGIGDHQLSGGVMNPKAIEELMPDYQRAGLSDRTDLRQGLLLAVLPQRARSSPRSSPPFFQKKGYHVVSLSDVAKWLAEKCEELGVEIYPGFAGAKISDRGRPRRRRPYR